MNASRKLTDAAKYEHSTMSPDVLNPRIYWISPATSWELIERALVSLKAVMDG
jgi:hypothetical protein